jgi:hypothetical protein
VSYESENYLPSGTQKKAVCEFMELLGFVQLHGAHPFRRKDTIHLEWIGRKNYESFVGIEAAISHKPSGALYVHTRTRASRSYHDLAQQNRTIREVHKRFGGSFTTDAGKSRYENLAGYREFPASARGVILAYTNLSFMLAQVTIFRSSIKQSDRPIAGVEWLDSINPRIIANNLVLPFLTAGLEDYFKSSFVALLRYSARKETFFKSARLSSSQLAGIAADTHSVEDAVAETLPFQRISSICEHFRALDPKLDLAGCLRRPYRRRKSSLFDEIELMVERRHALIHQSKLNTEYSDENIDRDLNNIHVAARRCIERMSQHFDWNVAEDVLL